MFPSEDTAYSFNVLVEFIDGGFSNKTLANQALMVLAKKISENVMRSEIDELKRQVRNLLAAVPQANK